MQIQIDASVFASPTRAFGRVHGVVDLHVVPRQGEVLDFTFAKNGTLPINVSGFQHRLKVEEVIHPLQSTGSSVILLLEPIVAQSSEDARKITQYLNAAFGLYVDEY